MKVRSLDEQKPVGPFRRGKGIELMNRRSLGLCAVVCLVLFSLTLPLYADERPPAKKEDPKKIELLTTLSGVVTDILLYGETPHGVRMDVAFEGQLSGEINGFMRGMDYVLVRPDGVFEINVHATITTDDGAIISAEITGNMVDGSIRDTHVVLETGHPDYQWLHDQVLVGRGAATETELTVRYYRVF